MATAQPTVDHDEIREWVEARGGHPAAVKRTGRGKDPGILRIDFPGFSGETTLEEISWEEWFEWFDRDKLAILLSDEKENRFNKLVSRATASKKGATKKAGASKKASGSTKKAASGSTKKAASSTKKAATSSKKAAPAKKAASSTKKAAPSTKKAAPAKKASSGSTKKAAASTRKAAPAKKASSGSTKKASSGSTKKAAPAKKAAGSSKKAAPARKAATTKKATTKKTAKRSSGSSVTTTDHDEIRNWVEARGGFPAHVKRTGKKRGDPGVLRIDYPGFSGTDTLERIDWEQWFEWFDRDRLAFLYQDKKNSRFSKLIAR